MGNLRKAWEIPGKAKSLGWQNPQDCKIPGTAKSSGRLNPQEGKIPRMIKSPGQQNPRKSRARSASLYIYKGVAILFLSPLSTSTVLKLGGWNLDTDRPQYSRWQRRIFFGIGPRVPELGPNFGQILTKNRYISGTAGPIWLKFWQDSYFWFTRVPQD